MIINSKKAGGGITPTGTIVITADGTYDVTDKASAFVSVSDFAPLLYASNVENMFSNIGGSLPPILTLHFGEKVSSLKSLFKESGRSGSFAGSKLTLYADGTITNLYQAMAYMRSYSYETIEVAFDTSHVTDWTETGYGNYDQKYFEGEFDCSAATTTIYFTCHPGYDAGHLITIRFKANTIPQTLSFKGQPHLSTASLVSIANGLKEGVTGKQLLLQETPKAAIQTLTGTVAMDETNTFHVFTEDSSGTVTLENFITQTKGWTIA